MIEVKDVSFSYHDVPVLNKISFEVSSGEFVALVGENGTGKSTLLRLLLGELPPQSGEISLFGQEIRLFRQWWRIGYVPQNAVSLAADFPASVLEVVMLSLYHELGSLRMPGRRERERALAALEKVGMREYAKRMIGRLSGGQIQRVMIARVLAAGAELLLLDEPASGMDAASVDRLHGLLAELSARGMTILMVTHDLARMDCCVNRALCLDRDSVMHLHHYISDVRCIHNEENGA